MKTLKLLVLFLALVSITTAFEKPDKWVSIQSKKFGFKLDFPKNPKQSTQNVDSQIGKLKMNLFIYDATNDPKSDNLLYLANYTEYPENTVTSDNKEQLAEFFKGAVNGAVSNVQGKLIAEKVINVNGYEGREIKVDYQNGSAVITMQMYLVKNKMYMLETICETSKDNNKSMERFMSSFQLL